MSVYFVQSGDDGPIKIGLAGNVKKRLAALQTAHPHRLTLLGVLDGDADLERELHRRFKEHRLTGEWFSPIQELLDAIPKSDGEPEKPMPYEDPEESCWLDFCEPRRLRALVNVGLTMCGDADDEIAEVARSTPDAVASWAKGDAMPSLEQFLRMAKEYPIFRTCLSIAINADANTWEGDQVRASLKSIAAEKADGTPVMQEMGRGE